MRRLAVALAAMMILAPLALAAPDTLKGTVIDTACYTAGKHGAEEKGCTQMCINMGVPPSLLTDSGEVVLLLPSQENMEAYGEAKKAATKKVEVSGMVVERGGLKAVIVKGVKVSS